MKREIIEHLFNGAITILKRSITSDRKISGFATIVLPVEKKRFRDHILFSEKFRDKR